MRSELARLSAEKELYLASARNVEGISFTAYIQPHIKRMKSALGSIDDFLKYPEFLERERAFDESIKNLSREERVKKISTRERSEEDLHLGMWIWFRESADIPGNDVLEKLYNKALADANPQITGAELLERFIDTSKFEKLSREQANNLRRELRAFISSNRETLSRNLFFSRAPQEQAQEVWAREMAMIKQSTEDFLRLSEKFSEIFGKSR